MVTAQITALYRRGTRALRTISVLFLAGLSLTLAGAGWLLLLNRATAATDTIILTEGARLSQNVLLAERSYQRYLMTGEHALLAAHGEADAGIGTSLARLAELAESLSPWRRGLAARVSEVRRAVDAWRAAYVQPAIAGRLSHLWRELEIFRSNKGEAAWVTRLDSAVARLRQELRLAAAARSAELGTSRMAAHATVGAGLLLQLLALLVLVPAGVHGLKLLRDRGRLSVSLMDAAELIQDCPDEGSVAEALVTAVVADTGAGVATVVYRAGTRLAPAAVAGRDAATAPGSPILEQPAMCPVMGSGRPFLVAHVRRGKVCDCQLGVPATGGYACFPITARGQVHGVLNVQAPPRIPIKSDHYQDHFATLARMASMAINGQQVLAQAHRQATTDPLTGAYNRRYFETSLVQHVHSARRRKSPLAILMFDLDYFKAFNDTHGHQAGDALLEVFARVVMDALRKEDVFARYGGEEFVAVLPNTDKEVARQIAERIRESVHNLFIPGLPHLPRPLISVSVGVSAYPDNGETDQELLHAADTALYQAKGAGRDRVLIF